MTEPHDSSNTDPLWDEGLRAAFGEPDEAGDPGAPSVLARIEERIGRTSRVFLRDTQDRADAPILDISTDQKLSSTQRYQVLGEIARGGIGVVLQGRDTNLGRDVALKVLRDRHRDSGELIQRFVEEAQIGGQLQHPGIVPVYDLGLDGDRRPFFTMKLVKGRTLAALLAERKDATDRGRFFSVFATICQTIAYAHSRGVIHRDLKPANVMVGAFGEVQVMDWGFAKVLAKGGVADETLRRPSQAGADSVATVRSGPDGSASFAGSIYGTPAYMPPEQAQGGVDRLDERADVFALGSILCEILTGDPPHRSDRDRDVIEAAAAGQLDDAHQRLDASGADPELIGLARRCLQTDPANRPRHAGSVAEEMSAYLATVERRATEARVDAAAARVRVIEERKSRRLAVALVTSIAALIALVAIGAWWMDRRSSDARARLEGRVTAVLQEGEASAVRGDWPAASLAVERAVELVASGDVRDEIRRQVTELKERTTTSVRRLEQRDQLENLRLQVDNDPASVERAYERVLTELGVRPGTPTADLGGVIASFDAATRIALGSALDDWALRRYNRRQHTEELGAEAEPTDPSAEVVPVAWIVGAARQADPDEWRGDLRTAALTGDVGQLRRLADSSDYDRLPPSSLNLLGLSLCTAGATSEGIAVLSEAFDRYPESFWISLHLSRFYRQTRDVTSAERHALIARSLKPNSSAAWLELALLEMESGDTGKAETYLAKAEELSAEQRAKWAKLLARTRTERTNRWIDDNARRTLMRMGMRRGGRRGPERGRGRRSRGGDLTKTVERLEARVNAKDSRPIERAELGYFLLLVGDLARAESYLAPLMDTTYRRDAIGARAEVLFGLGKYDAALTCAREAIRMFSGGRRDPGASQRLDSLRKLEKRLRAAIPIERALRAGPDVSEHDPLLVAIVVQQTGDPARAEVLFARAFDETDGPVWPRTDPWIAHSAACAAVAAGMDSSRSDDARRASFARARAWLEAGFTVVGVRTEGLARGILGRRIRRWQHDVRLAPTRKPARLRELGEAEVEAWKVFWRRYEKQLTRTER